MQKVVINACFGGFSLSDAARQKIAATTGSQPSWMADGVDRDNPALVSAVAELGRDAAGGYASLVVVEIPDGVKWHIHEYDGYETIHEEHRSWGRDGQEIGC